MLRWGNIKNSSSNFRNASHHLSTKSTLPFRLFHVYRQSTTVRNTKIQKLAPITLSSNLSTTLATRSTAHLRCTLFPVWTQVANLCNDKKESEGVQENSTKVPEETPVANELNEEELLDEENALDMFEEEGEEGAGDEKNKKEPVWIQMAKMKLDKAVLDLDDKAKEVLRSTINLEPRENGLQEIVKAVDADPQNPVLHYVKANYLVGMNGMLEDALLSIDKAIELYGSSGKAYLFMHKAGILQALEKWEDCSAAITKGLEIFDQQGDTDFAVKCDLLHKQLEVYSARQKNQDGLATCDQLAELLQLHKPEPPATWNSPLYYSPYWLYGGPSDLDGTIGVIKSALLNRTGNHMDALAVLQNSLMRNSSQSGAGVVNKLRVGIANTFWMLGDIEESTYRFEDVLELYEKKKTEWDYPVQAQLGVYLGKYQQKQSEPIKPIHEYIKWCAENPPKEAHSTEGVDNPTMLKGIIDEVSKRDDPSIEAVQLLAYGNFLISDFPKARELLDKLIELKPNNVELHLMKHNTLSMMELQDEMEANLTTALKFAPENPDLIYEWATLLANKDQFDEALEFIFKSVPVGKLGVFDVEQKIVDAVHMIYHESGKTHECIDTSIPSIAEEFFLKAKTQFETYMDKKAKGIVDEEDEMGEEEEEVKPRKRSSKKKPAAEDDEDALALEEEEAKPKKKADKKKKEKVAASDQEGNDLEDVEEKPKKKSDKKKEKVASTEDSDAAAEGEKKKTKRTKKKKASEEDEEPELEVKS